MVFWSKTKVGSTRPSLPATANGERIYAIGDVHGRYDLLRDLLEKITAHSDALKPTLSTHVILLGDLVDRGPDARDVVDFAMRVQQQDDRLIVLAGNHEDMMVRALDGDDRVFRGWMRIGGRETLRSFGIEVPAGSDYDVAAVRAQAIAAISPDMIRWMRQLPLSAVSGDYFFCHAGVRPGVPIRRQTRSDLLWIREDFLEDPASHGSVIVHGHSTASDVEFRSNRIGIDTAAYRSGVLTALYLEGGNRDIIATAAA